MSTNDYVLNIDGDYYNTLEIESFSRMMDSPSFCYKFYWLDAIVDLISADVTETTFNEIINEMIASAWYSVVEFHIHLSGVIYKDKDNLEKAVNKLSTVSGLKSSASKTEIKNAISEYDDLIAKEKNELTKNVPYKALSGFFRTHGMGPLDDSVSRMVDKIIIFSSQNAKLPYTLGKSSGLKREVYFDSDWIDMIRDNTVSIKGWIQYEKLKWLQKNNPEVPGLVYKLAPLDEHKRKLTHVRNLWEGIYKYKEIKDVFTDDPIVPTDYDVDHFVPFSFVMNDELWNLMPMDPNLNSGKGSKLPSWDRFFTRFARNQFIMYEMIHSKEDIHTLYEKCFKDNLFSVWAIQELYRQGNDENIFFNILSDNMRPVYDSALRQGYGVWEW